MRFLAWAPFMADARELSNSHIPQAFRFRASVRCNPE